MPSRTALFPYRAGSTGQPPPLQCSPSDSNRDWPDFDPGTSTIGLEELGRAPRNCTPLLPRIRRLLQLTELEPVVRTPGIEPGFPAL